VCVIQLESYVCVMQESYVCGRGRGSHVCVCVIESFACVTEALSYLCV